MLEEEADDNGYDPVGLLFEATIRVSVVAPSRMSASRRIDLMRTTSMSPIRDFKITAIEPVSEEAP